MTQLASNIQKGGALLDDTRRFVEVLDPTLSAAENLDQILDANLLAKASRSRLEDVLARILVPRFIDPGEQIMAALRHLLTNPTRLSRGLLLRNDTRRHAPCGVR
ncbi:MAG: DUF1819 family protein [Acidobacteria bacterium]|nr:DUF1819 family protein [Acidobacteriota bacterium]